MRNRLWQLIFAEKRCVLFLSRFHCHGYHCDPCPTGQAEAITGGTNRWDRVLVNCIVGKRKQRITESHKQKIFTGFFLGLCILFLCLMLMNKYMLFSFTIDVLYRPCWMQVRRNGELMNLNFTQSLCPGAIHSSGPHSRSMPSWPIKTQRIALVLK